MMRSVSLNALITILLHFLLKLNTTQFVCMTCPTHFLLPVITSPLNAENHQLACFSFQDTLYVWTEPRLCTGGVSLPSKRSKPCQMIDFWLKVGAVVGAFSAALLVALTCHFWKKNKK